MVRLLWTVLLLLSSVTSSPAQSLRDQVSSLFQFGTCGQPLCLNVPGLHERHFIPDVVQGNSSILGFLSNAISTSVGSIPISSASGGSTFEFVAGAPVQTSISSGPIFGERALTLGRNGLLIGANVTRFDYRSLRGVPLNDLEFNFTHQNVGGPAYGDPIFENDVLQVRTDIDFRLTVGTIYATYGLFERVDIGVAVPVVRASLRGTSQAQLQAFGGADTPHQLSSGSIVAQSTVEGSSTGIGDVAGRVKVNLGSRNGLGVGVLGDVRLPTGDEDDFLGAGEFVVRAMGIFSGRVRDFSPHVNGGFVYRGGEGYGNAALVTVGFDQMVSPRVTIAFDVFSEWQIGKGINTTPAPVQFTTPFQRTVHPTAIPDMPDDIANAAMGAKLLLGSGATLVVNSIVPLNQGGLRPGWGWTVGMEHKF